MMNHVTRFRRNAAASLCLLAAASLAGLADARASVYLNELSTGPVQRVELYNAGPGDVDVGGWTIQSNLGEYTIPSPSPMAPGSYLDLLVGDIQDYRGGITSLIDIVPTPSDGSGQRRRAGRDSVFYGQEGSAPAPPPGASLARAPDASAGPPPPPDPATDGLVWTIDFSPTWGQPNDAPQPLPGSGVVLNEMDPQPEGGGDLLELYNPTADHVELEGWLLVNGVAVQTLNGFLPPHGYTVVVTEPSFDLAAISEVYLFDPGLTRVDQLGFWDAPPLAPGMCLARCPDGAPPYLGYSYPTSGGGVSFLPAICTFESPNCDPTAVGGDHEYEQTGSWGRVKQIYR